MSTGRSVFGAVEPRPNAPPYVTSHTAQGYGVAYDHFYDTDPWRRYLWNRERAVLRQILRTYYVNREVDFLDFACGTGRIASALEGSVRFAVGVDVSEPMLEVAREKLSRTSLFNLNLLTECPFPRGRFNLITAFRFFVNAEPELRSAALKALGELLADDGCLVINNHQNLRSPYFWAARHYASWSGASAFNVLSMSECRDMLGIAGLEVVRVYSVGLLHLPKVRPIPAVCSLVDLAADALPPLASWSDSPIIVAQRARPANAG